MDKSEKKAFLEKLQQSTRPKSPERSKLETNVRSEIDRTLDGENLYKFQNPSKFDFRKTEEFPKGSTKSFTKSKLGHTDDRDVELLRSIQKASRKPKFEVDRQYVAPNDETIISSLKTAEDVIAFFSANGSESSVKYVLLNKAPRTLEFRPYDLVVVPTGHEESEHYIMSATGAVHVIPGQPSDVVSLADYMRESSLFNILRKIPFFKHFLMYKAFFRMYQRLRTKKYVQTRQALSKDLLIAKATFALPSKEILKGTSELASVPLVEYLQHGKHDYFVDDFRAQQAQQRLKAVTYYNEVLEKVEAKMIKFADLLRARADVPDLNTREALEQYLLANSKAAANSRAQKVKSMVEAREEQHSRMQELKRSIVEFSKVDTFVRAMDAVISERLFCIGLSTVQNLLNILREQGQDDVRKIGFQILLQPTSEMEFNPQRSALESAWDELFSGSFDTVGSVNHLCYQKAFKQYFSNAPKIWSISGELKSDSRSNYMKGKIAELVESDYEQANAKMVTYTTTLPHIHFLQKDWPAIEEEWKEQTGEEILSALSLSKVYRRLQEAHDAMRVLMASLVGHMLWINAGKLKTEVEPRLTIIRDGVNQTLRRTTLDCIQKLNIYFKQKTQLLNNKPQNLVEFADYVSNYKIIVAGSAQTDALLTQTETLCDLMDRQQVEFVEDDEKQLKERTLGNIGSNSVSLRVSFDEAKLEAEGYIEENMASHVEALQSEITNIEDECVGLQQIMTGEEFVALSDNTEPIMQYLEDIKVKLDDIQASETQLTKFGGLFDQKPFDWSFVKQTTLLYETRLELWSILCLFNEKMEVWFETPLKQLNTIEMEEDVNKMVRRTAAAQRTAIEKEYEDDLAPHLIEELQSLRQNMSTIHDCGNKHMTNEQWNIVLKKITGTSNSYHDGLNLRTLQERDVFSHKEVLSEQSGLATGKWRIKNDLEVIRQVWEGVLFSTKPYKSREGVYILDEVEEVIQQLEEHQVEIQTIMASRFVSTVKEEVEVWVKNLRLMSDVIEEWITLQRNWMYLEFIFSSDDIKEQLPNESKQFNDIDRLYRSLTNKANTVKRVFEICTAEGLLEELKTANATIDFIQKKLEDYLETKRIAFPRFYFLSNDELLSILSDVRNPQSVQPHLSKCFDSIAALTFSDEQCTQISGMKSGEGETVRFTEVVYPVGSVEQWLNEIEKMMKLSLHSHMRSTIEAYPQKKRAEWFFDHPAQCIQAVDMIVWTGEVEAAIASTSLSEYHSQYQKQILQMVDLVKGSLSKLERSLVCTLIVLDVHNRDIVATLNEQNVSSPDDFNWSQQLRYYWQADKTASGGMNLGIQHCSAHLWYGYEYLGNQPRLVITPLTDRAFLTCTSALGMSLGAAPQGPAGTGKTESVKDLGKALARQVVVFNCSDGINYKTMSRMFAGLAQAGAWACFDEFNRIELEVLSVIAQQMLEITTALTLKQERMNFDGHPIRLSKNFGVFITMNPGYAGRTELPDNLKALFRPICMMIPDYALIAEIMFYSEGFSDARTLARKMVQLYKLSSEQLSKQDHYDFGMRAVKSILVMAGSLKRQNPDEGEDLLLIRAMRDANVPKFLRDDTILFMALVKDLFPTVQIENVQNELLLTYLKAEMEKQSLQIVDGLTTKILQLFDTLVVRHGVMMVGQTLTGKTTTVNIMQSSLTRLFEDGHGDDGNIPLFNRVHTHVLNPKSVTMGELYGQVNEITREWTDGILSDIARTITKEAQTSTDRHWVIFDGPVDAVWIENMNTVLDDNKLLCLFNGERIKLPSTATFMFEVQDLRVASPATVSRCGMVYMEPFYLDGNRGWKPIAKSLALKKAAANDAIPCDRLLELLDTLLPASLDFLRRSARSGSRPLTHRSP
ncbi:Dynein heavy chain, N-terminal region 2/Hydrolytic ATP binding site of dynein motor region/AAA domain (dynein-related subfamily), putative [Angomonas deanei]|uniref:Dynein heavy chain, N-terminal region 2/Hydrolytic ATP binding site of dynein motor region/AAA domain (Dynein-related subfamily), putative n=1 Tax=Angomonas deanei TaxID=59799 RepID=A0A7G2CA20_9TRYP|nr:Dynein heavy chain, N-terminal region 2/Hydrolytic ATP binding site of dynein motor region/AAA domain (dynein-related subfamily), putative [Angomonas deanei]